MEWSIFTVCFFFRDTIIDWIICIKCQWSCMQCKEECAIWWNIIITLHSSIYLEWTHARVRSVSSRINNWWDLARLVGVNTIRSRVLQSDVCRNAFIFSSALLLILIRLLSPFCLRPRDRFSLFQICSTNQTKVAWGCHEHMVSFLPLRANKHY